MTKDKTAKFERKAYSREEINIIVAEQLGIGMEPICRELGQVMEGFNIRLKELEASMNTIIKEVKEWQVNRQLTIQ